MTEQELITFYQPRVTKGAKWLDKKLAGWFKHINTALIDMECIDNCIGGQLEKHELAWTSHSYDTKKGLSVSDEHQIQLPMAEQVLKQLWITEISNRSTTV